MIGRFYKASICILVISSICYEVVLNVKLRELLKYLHTHTYLCYCKERPSIIFIKLWGIELYLFNLHLLIFHEQ